MACTRDLPTAQCEFQCPHHIHVAEQHEGKFPAISFWHQIYAVSAAGNMS